MAGQFGDRFGLDPGWHEVMRDWTLVAVRANCRDTAERYRRLARTEDEPVQCLGADLRVPQAAWERIINVFQLKNSPWTNIQSLATFIEWTAAERISKSLKTTGIQYAYGDTAGVFGYWLYENGICVEEFTSGDTPEFDSSNRNEKIAEGWQLSDDNYKHLRSKRRGKTDMNSIDIVDFANQIARELDLYIPYDPLTVSVTSGEIVANDPWTPDDFEDARLLLSKH